MKKMITMALLFAARVLAACTNNNGEEEDPSNSNNNPETQDTMTSTNSDMVEKLKELEYQIFDSDVFYEETEFEGEVKIHNGIVEAEYYDTFNEHDTRGTEAFNDLFPIL